MLHLFSSHCCSLRRHNIRTLSDACLCLSLLLLPRLLHFNCPSSFPSSLLSLSLNSTQQRHFSIWFLSSFAFFWESACLSFDCAHFIALSVCVCVCLTGIIVVSELEICWSSQQRTQSGGHQDSAMLLLLLLIRVCALCSIPICYLPGKFSSAAAAAAVHCWESSARARPSGKWLLLLLQLFPLSQLLNLTFGARQWLSPSGGSGGDNLFSLFTPFTTAESAELYEN